MGAAWSTTEALPKISTAPPTTFACLLKRETRTAQIISRSAPSTAAALSRTLNWPPIIHPEAKGNCACCLRLLGQWEPPNRSSETVSHPPSADHLYEIFRDIRKSAADDDARLLGNQLQ
jgi:hypothetical protein